MISAGSCSGSDYIAGVAGEESCTRIMGKKSPNSFSTYSWVWVALFPGSFPLSVCGRKEPGKIGEFKLLTSGASSASSQIAEQNHVDV